MLFLSIKLGCNIIFGENLQKSLIFTNIRYFECESLNVREFRAALKKKMWISFKKYTKYLIGKPEAQVTNEYWCF